jgi:hypothetical protein
MMKQMSRRGRGSEMVFLRFFGMVLFYFLLFCTAVIILSVRLSARWLLRDMTAHIAAGIQPSKVHCKSRQIIPTSILPLIKKESQGRRMASNVMIFFKLRLLFMLVF